MSIGEPKYKRGDMVCFGDASADKDELFVGRVCIIDAYGTFENPNEVSYDIMIDLDGQEVLWKHIPESVVQGYAGDVEE